MPDSLSFTSWLFKTLQKRIFWMNSRDHSYSNCSKAVMWTKIDSWQNSWMCNSWSFEFGWSGKMGSVVLTL